MTIFYKKWRITDRINDKKMLAYGYAVHEKVGEQWKHATYFPKLSQSVNEMFERVIRSELKDVQIDLDSPSAATLLVQYAKSIDEIKTEILEVVHD
jgi:hypothetical protein